MFALVTSEFFLLFVNTFTPDDKYSVGISRHSENKFKRLYLKKERVFFDFLLHFWNVHEIWNIHKIKKSILA